MNSNTTNNPEIIQENSKTQETRKEYKRLWSQNERFRKWLVKHTGTLLGRLTKDDIELLRSQYAACPVVNGRLQTATLSRLIIRAKRLADDYDFELSQALVRSRDIERLLMLLHQGEVCFSYLPFRTGEQVTVCGTLATSQAKYVNCRQSPQANVVQIAFVDAESGTWRSMNAANYIGIYGE